jgi:hypothetical protein
VSNELLSEDVYVSSPTISSTTHRTYSLRDNPRLSNPPSRGSRATSRVLNRMSSRGNRGGPTTARHRRQRTPYRTTVGRDNSNVFARRESPRAFGACIPVHIYIPSFGPQKNPKTRNTTTAAKSIRVLPILKQVPRIESAPRNACLATCDRQTAKSDLRSAQPQLQPNIIEIKQRPSPPQP